MAANLIIIPGSEVQCGDIFNDKIVTYTCTNWQGVKIRLHDGERDFILNQAQILVQRPAQLVELPPQGRDAIEKFRLNGRQQ